MHHYSLDWLLRTGDDKPTGKERAHHIGIGLECVACLNFSSTTSNFKHVLSTVFSLIVDATLCHWPKPPFKMVSQPGLRLRGDGSEVFRCTAVLVTAR